MAREAGVKSGEKRHKAREMQVLNNLLLPISSTAPPEGWEVRGLCHRETCDQTGSRRQLLRAVPEVLKTLSGSLG